jgi:chemotaxis protein MotB
MTDASPTLARPALRAWPCAALLLALAGCASDEDALRKQVADLRYDVSQSKQYNQDLKRRMRLAEARNRVLIDLVKGLTAEPGATAAGGLGRAHESLAALDRDLETLSMSLRQSRTDFTALREQRASLQDELGRATRTIEQARAEEAAANQRVAAFREMLLHVRTMMVAGNLKVQVKDNRMLLQMPEALLFDRGQAVIKKNGRALLDDLAKVLIAVGDREFQICGHTATGSLDRGKHESDWHLSAARAVNVTQYLVARGVPKARLSAAAHADTRPAAAGSAEDAWMNRRIEIVLMPRLDELPDLSAFDALVSEADADAEGGAQAVPSAAESIAAPPAVEAATSAPAPAQPSAPGPATAPATAPSDPPSSDPSPAPATTTPSR